MRADRVHAHVPPRLRPPGQGQVNPMAFEQGPDPVPVTGLEQHTGLRVALPETAEQAGNDLLSGRGDRRDAQLATFGIRGGRGGEPRLVQQAEHPVRVRRVLLARAGQPQPAALRAHQLEPEGPLHRGERGGNRRLRDHELLGGRADRPGLGHSQERSQLV